MATAQYLSLISGPVIATFWSDQMVSGVSDGGIK